VLQLGIALSAIVVLPVLPAAGDAVLLVPLTAQARAHLVGDAIGDGALLLGSGPVAGSIVVRGTASGFAWRMLRAGVLPLADAARLCDGAVGERRA